MDFVVATNNSYKFKELKAIFRDYGGQDSSRQGLNRQGYNSQGRTLHMPAEYGITFSYEEKGETFFENAFGKADALYSLLKESGIEHPVIADDSGLVVPSLNGEPGIMSARYGRMERGGELSDREKIDYLLSRLNETLNKSGSEQKKRNAYFVCSMVVILGTDRFFAVQETFHGEIALKPAGKGGFGYDPVFFIPSLKKTIAQLSDDNKNRISHRALAGRRILTLLDSLKTV